MQNIPSLCSSRKWPSIIRYARCWMTKHPNCKLQHDRYKERRCKLQHKQTQYPQCRKWAVLCKYRAAEVLCKKDSNPKCYPNTDNNLNSNNSNTFTPRVTSNYTEYFIPGICWVNDRRASTELTKLLKDFDDVFSGIVCYDGTFSLQIKPDSKLYQVPPGTKHMHYKAL